MGVYYMWINVTKQQRLENVFHSGLKIGDSCWYGCPQTNAILTLLASEWFGDLVVFVPDEESGWIEWFGQEQFDRIESMPDWPCYECAEDCYEDIAGVFKCAEGETWTDYDPDDPATDFVERPYLGPFDKDIIQYRYVVNESKHVWLDREASSDDSYGSSFDPFAIFLADSCEKLEIDGEIVGFDGIWIGDVIRPSHEPPGDGYADVTNMYKLW